MLLKEAKRKVTKLKSFCRSAVGLRSEYVAGLQNCLAIFELDWCNFWFSVCGEASSFLREVLVAVNAMFILIVSLTDGHTINKYNVNVVVR